MEQDHAVRRRDEARRIRLEQERDYARFQEQLKLMKKEVSVCWAEAGAEEYGALSAARDRNPSSISPQQQVVLGAVYLQSSRPGLSGSPCSSRTVRSCFSIVWAWFQ